MSFSNLQKITIRYEDPAVENMISMLKSAPFPSQAPIDASSPWSLGIEFDYLRSLKQKLETEWKWSRVEKEIGKSENYLVDYASGEDKLQVHFVHKRSARSDAIPLMLVHGWPGTFFDFHKVIEPLTNPPSADFPAFHVVIPSLPGYFKSTLPRRDGWNLVDTAKLFNGLMVDLLGYKKYAGQGGDWGSMIMRIMSSNHADSMIAVHFNMFRAPPPEGVDRSGLSDIEKFVLARREEFMKSGFGYFAIQSTKPFTIGLAIASSPLAVLTYIGEKMHDWSDPELIDQQDILDTVALYWLSGSFATSVLVYNQSFKERGEVNSPASMHTWDVKTKSFAFSAFKYEIGGAPKADIEQYGPLKFYKEHKKGGHFPALDNPNEFVEDLREYFGKNFA